MFSEDTSVPTSNFFAILILVEWEVMQIYIFVSTFLSVISIFSPVVESTNVNKSNELKSRKNLLISII